MSLACRVNNLDEELAKIIIFRENISHLETANGKREMQRCQVCAEVPPTREMIHASQLVAVSFALLHFKPN